MASIQRHGKGYRIKVQPGGRSTKPVYHTGYSSVLKAKNALEQIEAQELATRPKRFGKRMTIAEVLERYRASRETGPRPNDPYSLELACDRVTSHCARMVWLVPEDITPTAIEEWRAKTPRSRSAGIVLAVLLRYARDVHGQAVHPQALALLRPPRAVRTVEGPMLTDQQVATALKLATGIHESFGALVHCLARFGWRPITAGKMLVGDLVGDRIICRVKGGHTVEHPVPPETLAILQAITKDRKASEPLFIDPWTEKAWQLHGRGAIPNRIYRRLKVHSYDLKRYAATRLLDVMPVHLARVFTGHKTDAQLQRYARTNEERKQAAVAAMQLMGPPGTTSVHEGIRNRQKPKAKAKNIPGKAHKRHG